MLELDRIESNQWILRNYKCVMEKKWLECTVITNNYTLYRDLIKYLKINTSI